MSGDEIQLQILQKLHQQQQSLRPQQSALQHPSQLMQIHDQQKLFLDVPQSPDPISQLLTFSEVQLQLQLLQKLQQQQQSLFAVQSGRQQPSQLIQIHDQQKQFLDVLQSANISQLLNFSEKQLQLQLLQKLQKRQQSLFAKRAALQRQFEVAQIHDQQKQLLDVLESTDPIGQQLNLSENQIQLQLLQNLHLQQQSLLKQQSALQQLPPLTHLLDQQKPLLNVCQYFSRSMTPGQVLDVSQQNNFQIDTGRPITSQHHDQLQKLPAASMDSICQPVPEFSSSSLANLSQFRELVRKAAYPNESPSVNQLDTSQEEEIQSDQNSFVSFGDNLDIHLGLSVGPFSGNQSSGGSMLSNCENPKELQSGPSPKMEPRSLETPDMILNSMDSAGNDSSFQSSTALALSLQLPDMDAFIKVYKCGAVPKSIDVTRYSGYEELKLELAHVFDIDDQLKDHGTIGWKFFYVNHENNIQLFNDEPWEVFVNSVQSIKIFSAEEIQQNRMDEDLGKALPNLGFYCNTSST